MSRPRPPRAFTLVEVAVVLVCLALLAAIAIPTFARFISGTREGVAEQSAAAVVRDAQGLAALDGGRTNVQDADIDLILDTAGAGTSSEVSAVTYDATNDAGTMGTFTVVVREVSCTVPLLTGAIVGSATCPGAVISGPPATPPAPTLTPGENALTVSVTPGSGPAPSSYTVTLDPGGATCTITAPSTSCTITGLDPQESYTATVVATNDDGSSGPSVPSTPASPQESGDPGNAPVITYTATEFPGIDPNETLTVSVDGQPAPPGSTFTVTGTVPTGVTLDPETGTFTGPAEWKFRAAKIASGSQFSCALTTVGTVKCWGRNDLGQLGDGTNTSRNAPQEVVAVGVSAGGAPLTNVIDVSAGSNHACAVRANTTVVCWGANTYGQLGSGQAQTLEGGPAYVPSPVVVLDVGQSPGGSALTGATSVDVGYQRSCAVLSSGQARCWGYDLNGGLGGAYDGNAVASTPLVLRAPGSSGALSPIAAIAVDRLSCAVMTGGNAVCWGDNATFGAPFTVLEVASASVPMTDVVGVDTSSGHACFAKSTGQVACMGANGNGQLGEGTTTSSGKSAKYVLTSSGDPQLSGATSVSVADGSSCARLSTQTVSCWGNNTYGRLGLGTGSSTSRMAYPAPVVPNGAASGSSALTGLSAVSLGSGHGCVRASDGLVSCFGGNPYGEIALGVNANYETPQPVTASLGNSGFPAVLTVQVVLPDGRTGNTTITLTAP